MKQKKSKTLFYTIIILILAGIGFLATREIPVEQEVVEKDIQVKLINE